MLERGEPRVVAPPSTSTAAALEKALRVQKAVQHLRLYANGAGRERVNKGACSESERRPGISGPVIREPFRPSSPVAPRAEGVSLKEPGAAHAAGGRRGRQDARSSSAPARARAPASACPRRCAMQCGEWLGLAEERTVEF